MLVYPSTQGPVPSLNGDRSAKPSKQNLHMNSKLKGISFLKTPTCLTVGITINLLDMLPYLSPPPGSKTPQTVMVGEWGRCYLCVNRQTDRL